MFIARRSENFLIPEVRSNQDRNLFQGNHLCTRIDGMTLGGEGKSYEGKLAASVRRRFRCAQAMPDTLRPVGLAWLRPA